MLFRLNVIQLKEPKRKRNTLILYISFSSSRDVSEYSGLYVKHILLRRLVPVT